MMKRPAAFTCLRRTISSVTAAATSKIDIRRLRDAKPADQAVLLRRALASPTANNTSITSQLLDSVATGSLPDLPVRTWLSIADDPQVTVAVVCQRHSVTLRRLAMPVLTAQLRRDATFVPTWDALGGSEGIAKLLAQFSLTDLRLFIKSLRETALAGGQTRTERQQRIGELFKMLNDGNRNPDKRPLEMEYAHLLPSCPAEMALAWTDQNSRSESVPLRWRELLADNHLIRKAVLKRINRAHRTTISEMNFRKPFSASEIKVSWGKVRQSLAHSRGLRLKGFQLLAASNDFHRAPIGDIRDKVILPLARQHSRRRCDPKAASEFWTLLIEASEGCPALLDYNAIHSQGILRHDSVLRHRRSLFEYAVRAWGHNLLPDTELAAYLETFPDRESKRISVEVMLKQVPRDKRRLSDMLRELKISIEVFLLLPRPEAINLFERLQDAHPGYGYSALEPWNYNDSELGNLFQFSTNNEDESLNPDGPALRGFLLRNLSNSPTPCLVDPRHVRNHLRVTELSRRKSLSQQGRTAEVRAFWAISACRLCIAMGDIDAYIDTLIWARRFNKDAMVLKLLYDDQQLHIPPLLRLLSAMDAGHTTTDIQENMRKANKVLMTLLETAAMTVDLPSFCRSDWESVYQLIPKVAELRLKGYQKMKVQMRWSEEQVFNVILQPTLDTMVAAESLILRPGNQRLGFQNPNGFALFSKSSSTMEFTPMIVRFLDMLAKNRDSLWAGYRMRLDPEVSKLQSPWPKGLPVQCLWPQHHISQAGDASYLQKRAQDVVFCDPQVALSPAPGSAKAHACIGVFVDDWSVALRVYLHGKNGDSEYETQLKTAWDYALHHLTGDRMSTEEAQRFWARVFPYSPLIAKVLDEDAPRRCYANIPKHEANEPSRTTKWDPDPSYNAMTAYRKDERRLRVATVLDSMVKPGWKMGTHWTKRRLTWMEPIIPKHSKTVLDFWHPKTLSQCPGSELDSQMMAAVLCLNSTHGTSCVLSEQLSLDKNQTFDSRLLLSKGFLERESMMFDKIVSSLRLNRSRLPPQLLEGLGISILRRIQEDPVKIEGAYELFYIIVRMLSDGPQPSLASSLIKEFIVEVPQASDWHRYLLSSHHLNRLEPKDAEAFIESLSGGIVEKLRLQKARQASETGHTVSESLIRVSTVKSVEQLLRGKNFTTSQKAVNILGEILRHSSHVEIQVAAIKALTGLLTDECDNMDVLSLLEQYAVPIASALNERHPDIESEWKSASNGGELPLVDHSQDGHTVLGMLMPRKRKPCSDALLKLATKALRISSQTNSRWLAVFMEKYGFGNGASMLPKIPTCPEKFLELLRQNNPHSISVDDFTIIRDYVLFLLDQPKDIRDFTTYVQNNRRLASSNTGRHWIHLWSKTSKEALDLGGGWAAEILASSTVSQIDGKTSKVSSMAEDFVLRMAEIAILRGDLALFDDIVSRIPTSGPEGAQGSAGSDRVIRQLIKRIDELRTPEWQADHYRRPSALPNTLPLRLRLLNLSHGDSKAVAEMIVQLLREVTTGGRLYYDDFEIIRTHIMTAVSKQSAPSLAIALGSLDKLDSRATPTQADHLRTRLAAELLGFDNFDKENDSNGEAKDKNGLEIWEMLNKWSMSPIEEFRNLAWQMNVQVR
ncbi:unnamed protein product [Clonostachys byssicola]|uniref:Uncharacterized protein n=1 Tax=Clonostachys byssicola TaxID=160290 RepID=A0A9N9UC38_9HYPO|nr:unnamed protein product [Clonostachys byssicola]